MMRTHALFSLALAGLLGFGAVQAEYIPPSKRCAQWEQTTSTNNGWQCVMHADFQNPAPPVQEGDWPMGQWPNWDRKRWTEELSSCISNRFREVDAVCVEIENIAKGCLNMVNTGAALGKRSQEICRKTVPYDPIEVQIAEFSSFAFKRQEDISACMSIFSGIKNQSLYAVKEKTLEYEMASSRQWKEGESKITELKKARTDEQKDLVKGILKATAPLFINGKHKEFGQFIADAQGMGQVPFAVCLSEHQYDGLMPSCNHLNTAKTLGRIQGNINVLLEITDEILGDYQSCHGFVDATLAYFVKGQPLPTVESQKMILVQAFGEATNEKARELATQIDTYKKTGKARK